MCKCAFDGIFVLLVFDRKIHTIDMLLLLLLFFLDQFKNFA